jgi:hypothetical protein
MLRECMHSETCVVSDHPVCAASVASRHFLTAQPPLLTEEGITRMIHAYKSKPRLPAFFLCDVFPPSASTD